MPDPKDSKTPLTAADVVKLFAKQNITVRMPKVGRGGASERDASGKCVMVDKPLAADLIVGINERETEVGITTADGRKYQAAK